MKMYLISALAVSANLFATFECEPKNSVFKYIAGGSEVTIGLRTHQRHGYDISLNHSLVLEKDYSIRGYYLNYPMHDKNILVYWGIGLGATYWEKAPFRNGKYNRHPPKGVSRVAQRTYITNAVVLGYEFHVRKNTKIFAQLELGNGILFLLPELFPAFKIGTSF